MELTYTKVGDYYIPDLILDDQPDKPLGRYGRMRQKFLEEHHPGTYNRLLLSGKLWTHLIDTDTACNERMDRLIPVMAQREGVTEALKAADQMEWVRRMNSIHNRAELPHSPVFFCVIPSPCSCKHYSGSCIGDCKTRRWADWR